MIELPPLPKSLYYYEEGWLLFNDAQMKAYATAAVLAERERCAKLCEDLDEKTFNEAPRPFFGDWDLHPDGRDCAAAIRVQGG